MKTSSQKKKIVIIKNKNIQFKKKYQITPIITSVCKITTPLLNVPVNIEYFLTTVKHTLNSISSTQHISNIFSNPLLFKFFISFLINSVSFRYLSTFLVQKIENSMITSTFYNRCNKPKLNLNPRPIFSYLIEKRLLRIVNTIKFKTHTTPWHFHSIVRFFEFCTGKKVTVKIFSFISNILTFEERAQCLVWSYRVKEFKKKLGTALFLNESLQVIYMSLKLKDPYLLSNWLTKLFQKISFWKFRTLMRYIKYSLRHFFLAKFSELNMKGVKMQLSGKISVAGNARTRTVRHKTGQTGNSTLNNKTLTILSCIPSFTGVQGFKIWFTF